MKRSRFGTRDRLSRDVAALQRLAIGFSESGGRLETGFWEGQLGLLVQSLLQAGAEDEISSAMDLLFEAHPEAHDALASTVEAIAESWSVKVDDQNFDAQLFAVPLLAWSRYSIPTTTLSPNTLQALRVQLGAHIFAASAQLALIDFLFSPDQLPRSFCDTAEMTRKLTEHAFSAQYLHLDESGLPETNRFLSDVRYLIGVVVVPRGAPIFRWNEPDGDKETALAAWTKQASPTLAPLLTGCAFQPLLADAYHSACREADRQSRAYAIKASVAFLQTTLGLLPDEMRAVIAPCHERRLEEYRIGLAPRDHEHAVFHGVVWALLGAEDEHSDIASQIEAVLREYGLKDIVTLEHQLPMEFCDDCGAPFFPNAEGELVHAEMPEQADPMPQTLH